MAVDKINPALLTSNDAPTQPELLISAVLHLMSHYMANGQSSSGCVKLASVIERHLKALAGLPNLGPVLRATCEQLSEQWAMVVERTMPPPSAKYGFLTQFLPGARLR